MPTPIVYFDLETTGLPHGGHLPDIIQIGAVDSYNKQEYDEYLLPNIPISAGATRVNGLTTNKRRTRLFHHNQEMNADEMYTGLRKFISWLRDMFDEPVLLVAHNAFNFDAKILLKNLEHYQIEDYDSVIWGFSDTLLASKDIYPQGSAKLEAIQERLGLPSTNPHDAFCDSHALRVMVRRMVNQNNLNYQQFIKCPSWCLPLSEMKRRYRIAEEVQEVPDYFTDIIHGLNSMRINSVY